jgi:hypothetical protein
LKVFNEVIYIIHHSIFGSNQSTINTDTDTDTDTNMFAFNTEVISAHRSYVGQGVNYNTTPRQVYRPPNMFTPATPAAHMTNHELDMVPPNTPRPKYRPPNMFTPATSATPATPAGVNMTNDELDMVPPTTPRPYRPSPYRPPQIFEESEPVRRNLEEQMNFHRFIGEDIVKLNDNVSVMKNTGVFLEEVEGEDDCECSICLDHTVDSMNGGKLPCGHTFHHNCIVSWFSKKKFTCPNCRVSVNILSILKK